MSHYENQRSGICTYYALVYFSHVSHSFFCVVIVVHCSWWEVGRTSPFVCPNIILLAMSRPATPYYCTLSLLDRARCLSQWTKLAIGSTAFAEMSRPPKLTEFIQGAFLLDTFWKDAPTLFLSPCATYEAMWLPAALPLQFWRRPKEAHWNNWI